MNYWRNLLKTISKPMRNRFVVFIVLFFCSFSTIYAQGNVEYNDRKAVIVILNYTNLEQYKNMSHLNNVMEKGAVGLMNTRGARKTDTMRAYASIGWGGRADVLEEHSIVHKNNEQLFVQNIQEIQKYNEDNSYHPQVGAIGNFFNSKGLTTVLISNPTDNNSLYYPASYIAMDSVGFIDDGEVYEEMVDAERIFRDFEKKYRENHFVVIDLGDLSIFGLNHADEFIGKVGNIIDTENTLLVVLSPQYSDEDATHGKKLTPVIFYGKNIRSGLLISSTTRRPGIIANIDIAPSIADFYGDSIAGVTGQPIFVQKSSSHLDKISAVYRLTAFNAHNRGRVLNTYIGFQIVLLLSTLILIVFPRKCKCVVVLRTFILFALVCPFTLFVMPLFKRHQLIHYVIIFIVLTSVITTIIYKMFNNNQNRIICISILMSLFIAVDLVFFKGSLNRSSLLGYNAVIGARYYGLGNEYMGVFVATVLLGIVPLVYNQLIPKWLGVIAMFITIPIIGLSIFGANVGGTITATIAYSFVIIQMLRKQIRIKDFLIIIGIVCIILSIFAIYDLNFSPQKSHFARALMLVRSEGICAIFNIVQRKLEVNVRLLRWTIWSKVLFVSIFVMAVLVLKPSIRLRKIFDKYKCFSIAWSGIIVASLVGMTVNDSGVVVAATSNIFLVFSLLYFILGEERENESIGYRLWG